MRGIITTGALIAVSILSPSTFATASDKPAGTATAETAAI